MKKTNRTRRGAGTVCLLLALLLTALTCMLTLTGCGKKPHPITLEENGAVLRDGKTGIAYRAAGFDLTADKIEGVYGRITLGQMAIDLFRAKGLGPADWLADEDGALFFAEGQKCPTMADFSGDDLTLTILDAEGRTVAEVKNSDTVASLTATFAASATCGTNYARPFVGTAERFDFYLRSPRFAGMGYRLICYVYEEERTVGTDSAGQDVTGRIVLYSMQNDAAIVLPAELALYVTGGEPGEQGDA